MKMFKAKRFLASALVLMLVTALLLVPGTITVSADMTTGKTVAGKTDSRVLVHQYTFDNVTDLASVGITKGDGYTHELVANDTGKGLRVTGTNTDWVELLRLPYVFETGKSYVLHIEYKQAPETKAGIFQATFGGEYWFRVDSNASNLTIAGETAEFAPLYADGKLGGVQSFEVAITPTADCQFGISGADGDEQTANLDIVFDNIKIYTYTGSVSVTEDFDDCDTLADSMVGGENYISYETSSVVVESGSDKAMKTVGASGGNIDQWQRFFGTGRDADTGLALFPGRLYTVSFTVKAKAPGGAFQIDFGDGRYIRYWVPYLAFNTAEGSYEGIDHNVDMVGPDTYRFQFSFTPLNVDPANWLSCVCSQGLALTSYWVADLKEVLVDDITITYGANVVDKTRSNYVSFDANYSQVWDNTICWMDMGMDTTTKMYYQLVTGAEAISGDRSYKVHVDSAADRGVPNNNWISLLASRMEIGYDMIAGTKYTIQFSYKDYSNLEELAILIDRVGCVRFDSTTYEVIYEDVPGMFDVSGYTDANGVSHVRVTVTPAVNTYFIIKSGAADAGTGYAHTGEINITLDDVAMVAGGLPAFTTDALGASYRKNNTTGGDLRFLSRADRKIGSDVLESAGHYLIKKSTLEAALNASVVDGATLDAGQIATLIANAKKVDCSKLVDRADSYIEFGVRINGAAQIEDTEFVYVSYAVYGDNNAETDNSVTVYSDICVRSYKGVYDAVVNG